MRAKYLSETEFLTVLEKGVVAFSNADNNDKKADMQTSYFTFGQCHVHRLNGKTFDCDCVVKITAKDPRQVMFDTFGMKWAMQYDQPPRMDLFPRGIIELTV